MSHNIVSTVVTLPNAVDILAATYQRAALTVNTKKTEVLPSLWALLHIPPLQSTLSAHLGNILTSDCDLDNDVQQRVKLASAAFGRLSHRVNLTTTTKVAVYKTICISVLLYGCKTWTPYRHHIKALEAFHMRCLKSILGIRWWHKVTHVETRHTAAHIDTAEHMLLQRQLRWIAWVCNSHVLQSSSPTLTLQGITQ